MRVYEIITERILKRIEEMEASGEPFYWVKPWSGGARMPISFTTQKAYNGINRILLEPGEYITFKGLQDYRKTQPEDAKIHIKKGCHKVPIFFYKPIEKKDLDGNTVYKENGEPEMTFFMRYYEAFHIEDIAGVRSHYPAIKTCHTPTENTMHLDKCISEYIKAEELRVDVVEDGSRCFYRPSDHMVRVPAKEGFGSLYEYYSALLHELIHSTSKGLKRNLGSNFGTASYSREELIAQIGSQMLLARYGISGDKKQEDNDIVYIKGWASYLKENKQELVKAAKQAEKAAEYFVTMSGDGRFTEEDEDPNSEINEETLI